MVDIVGYMNDLSGDRRGAWEHEVDLRIARLLDRITSLENRMTELEEEMMKRGIEQEKI